MNHFQAVAAMALRPEAGTRYIHTPMPVELITGPPGSGKSTLVRERAGERDAVIDLDLIADALSAKGDGRLFNLRPASWCARDAAVYSLAMEPMATRLWIIACAPSRQDRHRAAVPFADVRLTVLEVPPEECLRRIVVDEDERRHCSGTDWRALVEQWWKDYRRPTPDEGWTAVEVAG